MGCISSADVKNPKNYKPNKQKNKQIQPTLYKSKMDKSNMSKIITPRTQQLPSVQKVQYPTSPKIKKTTSIQFLTQYQITQTLKQSTRLQGPKLITNKISGAVNVLRIYSPQKINQQRLKKFHQILKFQLYTDEQENYLLIEQYCSGPSIIELFQSLSEEQQKNLSKQQLKAKQMQIYRMLLQIYDLINLFHEKKIVLGNLSLFSFKMLNLFEEQIKLIDYNFYDHEEAQTDRMGHAHNNSYQSDWQFFGYLLQFYTSSKSPIFIPHKMQYIQNDSSNAYANLISALLKGRQISRKQIEQINIQQLKISNQNVLNGYKFCKDVLRLIKARKRRNKHKAVYYSQQIFQFYENRNKKQGQGGDNDDQLWKLGNLYNPQQHLMLTQQNLHRLQTDRILNQIQNYIQKLNPNCEQHFTNYSMSAQNFRKLKQVFLITDKKQKLDEFKQLIPQIK